MGKKELIQLEKREIIYQFILKYPGVHLRKIIRELRISPGNATYHLDYLIKKDLIEEKYDERYIRYYAKNIIGINEKEILNFLRKETVRNILLYLLSSGYGSQINISKMIEKDPKTIAFHLKKLIEKNIIELTDYSKGFAYLNYKKVKVINVPLKKSREIIYVLKDPYIIYHILCKYENRFFDNNTTSSILKVFEFFFRTNISEKTESREDLENRIIKFFYEIFPPPFR